jgi:DNA-directed RNA polymerase specialized sigma24 family protein
MGVSPQPTSEIARDGALEHAIAAVLDGTPDAWPALAALLHEQVLAICRRRRYAAGSASMADVHRDLALRTLERLHVREHAVLREWSRARARYPDARFTAWLGAVVANLFIDHQRSSPDFVRRRAEGRRTLEAVHATELDPDERVAEREPTIAVEVARIARALLEPEFPAMQRRAVAMWLRGEDADAIAAELQLSGPAEARRLLHAARERLRRRFHDEEN